MANMTVEEFNNLLTTTLRNYSSELYDNVTLSHPALDLLRDEQSSATGREMAVPLEIALGGQTQWTDGSGTFSTEKTPDVLTVARYPWSRPLVSSVRVEWQELEMNAGQEQHLDLLRTLIRNAEKEHGRVLAWSLHAKAGERHPKARYFSFDEILGNEETDDDNDLKVGNIDSSEHKIWQAQRITLPIEPDSGRKYTIRQAFRHVRDEVYINSGGKNRINKILAGRKVFQEYEDSFDDKVQYVDFGEGQTQFSSIMFGEIEVRLDPDLDDETALFLDTSTWRFRSLGGNFMEPMEAQKVPGTLDMVTPLASVLSVGVSERRGNALLKRPEDGEQIRANEESTRTEIEVDDYDEDAPTPGQA